MANEYISKEEIIKWLDSNVEAWSRLQGRQQDVTTENFVENALLVYRWIISEVENLQTMKMG